MSLNGILPIAKSHGMVSKDVSRRIIKLFGKVKIGHAGTLDPLATGVLPILLGKATRLQDFLILMPKAYEFDVTFGYETSTLDAEGEIIQKGPSQVEEADVRRAVASFKGLIDQVPPLYSAVKFKGKPLYQYARQGTDLTAIPQESLIRAVEVYDIDLMSLVGAVATIKVRCSKGTYVRSLAKDIAKALDTVGTVTRLVRTISAGIPLQESISIEQLEEDPKLMASHLRSIETVDLCVLKVLFSESQAVERLKNGLPLIVDKVSFDSMVFSQVAAKVESGTDLLMIGPDEKAFGIGSIQDVSPDQIVIRMRRGL